MVYLKSVENVITLGKLIGLLFLFCLPLLSILFLKTKRNDLARPVMGTIFLVVVVVVVVAAVIIIIGRAKRAPHWGVQSRFRVIYVYMYLFYTSYSYNSISRYAYRRISAHIPRRDLVIFCVLRSH